MFLLKLPGHLLFNCNPVSRMTPLSIIKSDVTFFIILILIFIIILYYYLLYSSLVGLLCALLSMIVVYTVGDCHVKILGPGHDNSFGSRALFFIIPGKINYFHSLILCYHSIITRVGENFIDSRACFFALQTTYALQ